MPTGAAAIKIPSAAPTPTLFALALLLAAPCVRAETLTLAAGSTIRASTTKHTAYRVEVNFPWQPALWTSDSLGLSLNHAVSLVTFRDKNTVNAISWAPNLVLRMRDHGGFHPYLQLSLGLAYLSDDRFESDTDPRYRYNGAIFYDEGASDMGSHGQIESSVGLGVASDHFSVRARYYHYSNAGISQENGGMDVAEFGVGYTF